MNCKNCSKPDKKVRMKELFVQSKPEPRFTKYRCDTCKNEVKELLERNKHYSEDKISINGLPFIVDEIKEWNNAGLSIKAEMLKYDWDYRKKHTCACEPRCFAANKFANGIQETHCKKMIRARTQKFRKKIDAFLNSHPLIKRL